MNAMSLLKSGIRLQGSLLMPPTMAMGDRESLKGGKGRLVRMRFTGEDPTLSHLCPKDAIYPSAKRAIGLSHRKPSEGVEI
jgi:hypothetical protein